MAHVKCHVSWEIIFLLKKEIPNLTLFTTSKKKKINTYFISTKNRFNIKTALFRKPTSPFGKDTITEYERLSPTSFTSIKFTHKPFPSSLNYGLKLNVHIFICIFYRYIPLNFSKLSTSRHWTQRWPLTKGSAGSSLLCVHRVPVPSFFCGHYRMTMAGKGTQACFLNALLPSISIMSAAGTAWAWFVLIFLAKDKEWHDKNGVTCCKTSTVIFKAILQ